MQIVSYCGQTTLLEDKYLTRLDVEETFPLDKALSR